jgi:hypothetical protein
MGGPDPLNMLSELNTISYCNRYSPKPSVHSLARDWFILIEDCPDIDVAWVGPMHGRSPWCIKVQLE